MVSLSGLGMAWTSNSAATAEDWRNGTRKHDGSWWTDWARWLAERTEGQAELPSLGTAQYPLLQDALGRSALET
jgi:polyhydroxyalkanoate synthase